MTDGGGDRRFDAYSKYETVFEERHRQINAAVRAWAHVNSMHTQNVGMTPQTAVKAKRAISTAAATLAPEVRRYAHIEGLREIYERWAGVEWSGERFEDADRPGRLAELEEADFTREMPPWLGRMVEDILEVGFELGYTMAGRETAADPESADVQVRDMFD